MSALIRKSKIRKADSDLFRGRLREKKEILSKIKIYGLSERKFNKLLRDKYDYEPDRRKRIIDAIIGRDN